MDLRVAVPPSGSPVPPHLLDESVTLPGALGALAERFPDWQCLTILDRARREQRLTVRQLWVRAHAIRAALVDGGLRQGDVVLLILPTSPEIVAAYFAVMLAGGVPGLLATPSNRLADRTAYAARIGAIADNANARILYCEPEIATLFHGAARALLGGATLLTPSDVPAGTTVAPVTPPETDGCATVQYSSGSTGTPKGVLLTHRAMLNNIRAVRDGLGLTPRDVSVNWIPLYHDMGLIDAFLLPLLSGCSSVLIPTMDFMREPVLWLWALHHYSGTLSWAPNCAYTYCTRRVPDEALEGLDLSSWRIAVNAAEPVLASTLQAFAARFAPHGFAPEAMTPAWGLAENVTIATAHPIGVRPSVERIDRQALSAEGLARPGPEDGLASVAIGRCLPGCAVEIRDAQGRRLPDRHVGTVWLRSNSLFSGYHRNPLLTAQVLVDGWLDTGDQGYVADGNLYFAAREKDLIVIGGDKYVPHDVETVINRLPGVREGCVVAFGVLNEERGTEELAAVVETRESDAAAQQRLREVLRAEVTRVTGLALRHILLVPPGGVEKTSSGKLARRATQRRYAAQLDAS